MGERGRSGERERIREKERERQRRLASLEKEMSEENQSATHDNQQKEQALS